MIEFLTDLVATWWGVLIVTVVALALWVALSILLYRAFFKRFYDVLLSGIAILVLLPVFLVLIIVGAIKMRGNPFFTQLRPGKKSRKTGDPRIFKLIKFRTMTNAKGADGNLLPDKERLTKYGRILRSTSLDELPELFNIFIGNMSIVGPRPQLVRDMVFMSDEVCNRHDVRGGLTGLAQIAGRNNLTWEEKFQYDLYYIDNMSLIWDVKIILNTVVKVLNRSDVARNGMETDIDYGDWLLEKGKISKDYYYSKQEEAREILKRNH